LGETEREDPQMKSFKDLREKTLTPAEKKKREEIAKAKANQKPEKFVKPHPEVIKAYKKKLAADDKAADWAYGASKARLTRATNHLTKKIDQHHPGLDTQGRIDLYTTLQNMKEAVEEKTLTPAEKKKREEIAKAMERDNPGMDMKKKMAIATWQAKKVAEEVELEEGIENMSHARLKWHMNTGVPHGSYTKDEMKKERDRRLSRVDTHAAYKKAKPSMNEEADSSMCCKHCGDEFGKPTNEKCMYDAYDPKGKNWVKKESYNEAKVDEISLSHLSNKIANSTGTKNIKTAMKPGEVKKGLDDLKKRLATLGQEPKMAKEAYEEEPASPDEKSMAMRQAKFIQYVGDEIMEHLEQDGDFPEWMQNKLSELHQKAKDMHSTMAGNYEDDMDESTKIDEISKKTLGSYVKKASADVANRSADNARDYATGNRPVGANKKAMKNMKRTQYVNKAVDKMTQETVMSADKKPEKYIKPDGKVGIRMVRVDKNVVDKDA
jgi:hypothetical protein